MTGRRGWRAALHRDCEVRLRPGPSVRAGPGPLPAVTAIYGYAVAGKSETAVELATVGKVSGVTIKPIAEATAARLSGATTNLRPGVDEKRASS